MDMITEQELLDSPAWLPLQAVGNGELHLICLEEVAYRAASFLDQRLLRRGLTELRCGTEVAQGAAAQLTPRSHYVFHTGHVGSTLVSRLLGEHESLFCLREPAILRALAQEGSLPGPPLPAAPGLDLTAMLSLLSRTWRPQQRAVIKLSSFLSEHATRILSVGDQPAALLMFTDPQSYLRGILAGPNSRIESRMLAPSRLHRLQKRLGERAGSLRPGSEGEQVAMSWLCEMAALHEAAQQHRSRVLWVNFDAFLLEPHSGLEVMLRALGATASRRELEEVLAGPLMRQYSKAPEYAYDAELRRQVLESADSEHPLEIRRGMEWLGRLAQHHPLVEEVLASAAREGRQGAQCGSGAAPEQ